MTFLALTIGILVFTSILLVSESSYQAFASHNPNLFVSAENLIFDNYFSGSMSIEKETQNNLAQEDTTKVSVIPSYGVDTKFILECSTWYESYELTSKPEFIMVWGKGAITCYDMLDLWTGKLFLWHNENLITDEELETAIAYLVQKGHIVFG